jgi:hypothetical protein
MRKYSTLYALDGYSFLILGKIYQATGRWSLADNANM